MKKKIFISLLSLTMLSVPVFAENASDYEYYNDIYKSLSYYQGSGGDVVVPAEYEGGEVLILGSGTFSEREDITSITLSEGIQVMDGSAISYCENLASVTLPESLVIIDNNAFNACPNLKEITIPAGVKYVGNYGFYGLEELTVQFLGEAPVFGDLWFEDGTVLKVPDDQLEAYQEALAAQYSELDIQPSGQNMISVEEKVTEADFEFDAETGTILSYKGDEFYVKVPESIGGVPVKHIGEQAFMNKQMLSVLILPDDVETFEKEAFSHSGKLEYITVPKALREIGESAFEWTPDVDFDISGLENLEKIGDRAFADTNTATGSHTTFPENLKEIGAYAFEKNWGLSELYFPASIEKIGEGAFSDVEYIQYLCFEGAELPEIAPDAFASCKENLEDVDILWNAEREQFEVFKNYFAENGFINCTVWRNNPGTVGVASYPWWGEYTYKDGYLAEYTGETEDLTVHTRYESEENEDEYIRIIGIGDGVFKGNQTIKKFYPHHGDYFTTIGAEAFADSSLEYVEMFDSITTIGAGAFRNCVNLKELQIPVSVTSIGEGAFEGCTGLEHVIVDCDPAIIPAGSFEGIADVVYTAAPADIEIAEENEELDEAFSYDGDYEETEDYGYGEDYGYEDYDYDYSYEPSWLEKNVMAIARFISENVPDAAAETVVPETVVPETVVPETDSEEKVPDMIADLTAAAEQNQELSDYDKAEVGEFLNYHSAGQPVMKVSPDDLSMFVGEWRGIYLQISIYEGKPSETLGIDMVMNLNEDGSGDFNYGDPEALNTWYWDEKNQQVYFGENTEDSADTPIFITEEGFLQFNTPYSGYIIFSHNPDDIPQVIPQKEELETEPMPDWIEKSDEKAETAAISSADVAQYLEKKYVCTSADNSGYTINADQLGGEYSVVFHEDGNADFIMVGAAIPGLKWNYEDGNLVIDYYGQPLVFEATDKGFVMDYFGAMLMTFEAE